MLFNDIPLVLNRFIACVIIIVASFYSVSIILKAKIKINVLNIIVIITSSLILLLMYYYIHNAVKAILNLLMLIVGYKIMHKEEQTSKITMANIIMYIMVVISEVIFSIITIGILRLDPNYISNSVIGLPFTNLVISFTTILISMATIKFTDKIIQWYKNKDFINTIFIFGLILLCLMILILNNSYKWIFDINYIINTSLIFVFSMMIYIFCKLKYEKEKIELEYNNLHEYTKTYEILVEEYRKTLHENKNEWAVVYAMISMLKDKEGSKRLKDYVTNLVEIKKQSHKLWWVEQINRIGLCGLKGLFYFKLSQLDDDIKLYVNVLENLEVSILDELSPSNEDKLYKMTGVFLDNAIEAVSQIENKEIDVLIKNTEEGVLISISNTYGYVIEGKTTKGIGHGYGLKLVKDLVNSTSKIKYNTKRNDKIFTQEIIVLRK